MKTQINIRASTLTERQLASLAARWGTTITETVTVLIDRAYREETIMDLYRLLSGEMEPDATYPTTGETWHIQNGDEVFIDLGRVPGQPGRHVLLAADGTRRIVGGFYLRRPGETWTDFIAVDADNDP